MNCWLLSGWIYIYIYVLYIQKYVRFFPTSVCFVRPLSGHSFSFLTNSFLLYNKLTMFFSPPIKVIRIMFLVLTHFNRHSVSSSSSLPLVCAFYFFHSQNRRFRIYSIALIVSAIFLAMTLAIGFLIPSNHHVLHCRCQTYYVGCLLVGDLLLAINQSYGSLITGLPCLALGKLGFVYNLRIL